MADQNYTLGRGKIYFSRFKPGTRIPEGYRYIGNSPEFNLTIETETLDHFSSDAGIREKDDGVPLEVTRTGSFSTDNVIPANIAMFFFGTHDIFTQVAKAAGDETFTDVKKGMFYQLGVTNTNPTGVRNVTEAGFAVKKGATTFTKGTDYNINFVTGMLEIIETGAILNDDDIAVTWASAQSTRERVISGSEPVEGAMKYIADNPKGEDYDYTLPYVKITPNGDFALKGDEWQVIPFNLEALKPTNSEAILLDGRPFGA